MLLLTVRSGRLTAVCVWCRRAPMPPEVGLRRVVAPGRANAFVHSVVCLGCVQGKGGAVRGTERFHEDQAGGAEQRLPVCGAPRATPAARRDWDREQETRDGVGPPVRRRESCEGVSLPFGPGGGLRVFGWLRQDGLVAGYAYPRGARRLGDALRGKEATRRVAVACGSRSTRRPMPGRSLSLLDVCDVAQRLYLQQRPCDGAPAAPLLPLVVVKSGGGSGCKNIYKNIYRIPLPPLPPPPVY